MLIGEGICSRKEMKVILCCMFFDGLGIGQTWGWISLCYGIPRYAWTKEICWPTWYTISKVGMCSASFTQYICVSLRKIGIVV